MLMCIVTNVSKKRMGHDVSCVEVKYLFFTVYVSGQRAGILPRFPIIDTPQIHDQDGKRAKKSVDLILTISPIHHD